MVGELRLHLVLLAGLVVEAVRRNTTLANLINHLFIGVKFLNVKGSLVHRSRPPAVSPLLLVLLSYVDTLRLLVGVLQ